MRPTLECPFGFVVLYLVDDDHVVITFQVLFDVLGRHEPLSDLSACQSGLLQDPPKTFFFDSSSKVRYS